MLYTSYHPQSDGQIEVVNICLEMHLRCMCGKRPKEWCKWLPIAEWWYNIHFHISTKLILYEIVYNQKPPFHLPYLAGESTNAAVDRSKRKQMIDLVKDQLLQAQNKMVQ